MGVAAGYSSLLRSLAADSKNSTILVDEKRPKKGKKGAAQAKRSAGMTYEQAEGQKKIRVEKKLEESKKNLTKPKEANADGEEAGESGKRVARKRHDRAAHWARSTKNPDVSTGPLPCPFARSLAPLTRSLAPHYSLRSRAPLRSLVCSLAHFALSLARGTVDDWMDIYSVFFSILAHSGLRGRKGSVWPRAPKKRPRN